MTPGKRASVQRRHRSEHSFLKPLELGAKAVPEEGARRVKTLEDAIELESEFCSLTAHCVWPAVCTVCSVLGLLGALMSELTNPTVNPRTREPGVRSAAC